MHIVRIEHPVPSYDAWKSAFDGDPLGREDGGVTRYRILRDIADPTYVQIDLEFDDHAELLGERSHLLAVMSELLERGRRALRVHLGSDVDNDLARLVDLF